MNPFSTFDFLEDTFLTLISTFSEDQVKRDVVYVVLPIDLRHGVVLVVLRIFNLHPVAIFKHEVNVMTTKLSFFKLPLSLA